MRTNYSPKSERINLRVAESDKRVMEEAAAYSGQVLSKFILDAARSSAAEVIDEHRHIHLNAKDSQAFVRALLNPPAVNDKMKAAMRDYQQRVVSK